MASVYSDDEYVPDDEFGVDAELTEPTNPRAQAKTKRRTALVHLVREEPPKWIMILSIGASPRQK